MTENKNKKRPEFTEFPGDELNPKEEFSGVYNPEQLLTSRKGDEDNNADTLKIRTMNRWFQEMDKNGHLVIAQLGEIESFDELLLLVHRNGHLLPEALITNPKVDQLTVGTVDFKKVRKVLTEMERKFQELIKNPIQLKEYISSFGPTNRPKENTGIYNETEFLNGRLIPKNTNEAIPLYEFIFRLLAKKNNVELDSPKIDPSGRLV